jgi:hypothetical protein
VIHPWKKENAKKETHLMLAVMLSEKHEENQFVLASFHFSATAKVFYEGHVLVQSSEEKLRMQTENLTSF